MATRFRTPPCHAGGAGSRLVGPPVLSPTIHIVSTPKGSASQRRSWVQEQEASPERLLIGSESVGGREVALSRPNQNSFVAGRRDLDAAVATVGCEISRAV